LVVVRGGEVAFETTGTVEGEICDTPRGSGGFGYDPIFFYPPYGCTFGEVDDEKKLAVAHRGHAFRNLADWLRSGN
jgi:XTP/dITP diphosphohydrolase